jgi:hypothetical protein
MNFLPLALVTALLHVYIGARLVPGLDAHPAGQWLLIAGLVLSALLMPLGLMAGRVAKQPLADVLTWVGLLFMGLFSSMLVLTVARDAGLLLLWLADGWRPAACRWPGCASPRPKPCRCWACWSRCWVF